MINKKKLSINICFLMAFIIILIFFIVPSDNENEERVAFCGTSSLIIQEILVNYNNTTKNFEIEFGPFKDSDGNLLENANVSIKLNNTLFYNYTNHVGYIKIIIPEKSISISELNTNQTITVNMVGYDELKVSVALKYP